MILEGLLKDVHASPAGSGLEVVIYTGDSPTITIDDTLRNVKVSGRDAFFVSAFDVHDDAIYIYAWSWSSWLPIAHHS